MSARTRDTFWPPDFGDSAHELLKGFRQHLVMTLGQNISVVAPRFADVIEGWAQHASVMAAEPQQPRRLRPAWNPQRMDVSLDTGVSVGGQS